MRYQNWDVLLFPAGSRTPIQEFDTKCHVLANHNFPIAGSPLGPSKVLSDNFECLSQTPILTCFIPSLAPGAVFRVSIHSWEKPIPSSILMSYKNQEEVVMYEARVYVDGVLQAQRNFQEDTLWPEVIGSDTVCPSRQLQFPSFHPEILKQTHWEAGEHFGRIRLVLAEGVMREMSPPTPQRSSFDHLRDVVSFSFQHAPKSVLEYSGISWPNNKMFTKTHKRIQRPVPIGSRIPVVSGHELHSHSPQRPSMLINEKALLVDDESLQTYPPLQTLYRGPTYFDKSVGNALHSTAYPPTVTVASHEGFEISEDPFVGPQHIPPLAWRTNFRSSSHDVSMPDYISNKTDHSRSRTDMSGVSYPRKDFQRHMNEAAIDELVRALSPTRKEELAVALSPPRNQMTGLEPPTNTPLTGSMVVEHSESVHCQKAFDTSSDLSKFHKIVHGSRKGSVETRSQPNSPLPEDRVISSADRHHNGQVLIRATDSAQASPRDVSNWRQSLTMSCMPVSASDGSSLAFNRPRSRSNSSKRKRSRSAEADETETSKANFTGQSDPETPIGGKTQQIVSRSQNRTGGSVFVSS